MQSGTTTQYLAIQEDISERHATEEAVAGGNGSFEYAVRCFQRGHFSSSMQWTHQPRQHPHGELFATTAEDLVGHEYVSLVSAGRGTSAAQNAPIDGQSSR